MNRIGDSHMRPIQNTLDGKAIALILLYICEYLISIKTLNNPMQISVYI